MATAVLPRSLLFQSLGSHHAKLRAGRRGLAASLAMGDRITLMASESLGNVSSPKPAIAVSAFLKINTAALTDGSGLSTLGEVIRRTDVHPVLKGFSPAGKAIRRAPAGVPSPSPPATNNGNWHVFTAALQVSTVAAVGGFSNTDQ